MNWFEQLTGFKEKSYDQTRKGLEVKGNTLTSLVNGRSYGIGALELISLQTLRDRALESPSPVGRIKVSVVTGDVQKLHHAPQFRGALFQVASQFNLLEMVSPEVTPEHGVTGYINDPTQGPACAIAAGAATIYRNYFAQVGVATGQSRNHQLNGLADMGEHLAQVTGLDVKSLWTMQNGYAMCTKDGLVAIERYLDSATPAALAELAGKLCIGVHSDVEVTYASQSPGPVVSQAFCSALPVAYSKVPIRHWQAFASHVLDAAYEATILAGVLNARRGASNVVLLTRLGGGAFGNEDSWIYNATRNALNVASAFDLDVRLVSRGLASFDLQALVKEFA